MIIRCLLLLLLAATIPCIAGPDSIVTFNEIHYHPATEGEPEWVELHNQMGIRVDLGKWELQGGIYFKFPEGTLLEPGEYLVVSGQVGTPAGAYGPFSGKLNNGGEELRLHGRHGRLMDIVQYGRNDHWPEAADGSGVTLAKRNPELASARAKSWTTSDSVGGTPGAENFAVPASPQQRMLTSAGHSWKMLATDALPAEWNRLDYDDSDWQSRLSPFPVESQSDIVLLRKTFAYLGSTEDVSLFFDGQTSSSATLYLNGNAIGEYSPDAKATLLGAEGLLQGANLLGIEFSSSGDEVVFDGALSAVIGLVQSERVPATPGPIVINEIHYHAPPTYADPTNGIPFATNDEEWIELLNINSETVDLSGWRIRDGIRYDFPENTHLDPGSYLVVTKDQFSGALSNQGERIVLENQQGEIVDEVSYYDSGRWPSLADGGGSSLELVDPKADNSIGDSWAASDETERGEWREYSYRASGAEPAGSNNPDNWNEFLIGFLDAGEALIDDVSVREDPTGANRELILNGSFDADAQGAQPGHWRLLGTHRLGKVVADPEGNGNVLHLVATGELTHTYNNASITLANNRSIQSQTEYEIRFRAKWLAGSPQLNTRLYLNRAARTHLLPLPDKVGTPGSPNSHMSSGLGPSFDEVLHRPAVPENGESIFISGFVQDVDKVQSVAVHYRLDGDEWNEIPAALDESGWFLGILPGQGENSVIQFYVRATDVTGAVSTFPAKGEESRALIRIGDGGVTERAENNLRLIMLEADADDMHTQIHAVSNFRWGGTAIYGDRSVYYDVGVRLRSAPYGRRGRPGWNIRFGDEQPFRGVHSTVVVDAALNVPRGDGTGWVTTGDGASINEMLFNVVANRAGGIAATYDDIIYFSGPRRSDRKFAQLKMMRFEDAYLDEFFPDGSDGNLYKQELIYYPTSTANGRPDGLKNGYNMVKQVDIRTMGNDKEAYRFNYLLRNNRKRDDFSSIIGLGRAFSSGSTLTSDRIEEIIDVDNWMRTLAINALFGVADTYNNGLAHNLVFYARPDDGRVMIFPWDLDHAMYYSYESSIFGQGTHRVKTLIDRSVNRRRFRGHLLDICTIAFNSEFIDPWADHLHEVAGQSYSRRLKWWIAQRRNFVLKQIENESPRVEFAIDADVDGQSDESLVELRGAGWVDVHSFRVIRRDGESTVVPASFRDGVHWNLRVPLYQGENVITVEALNYQGSVVGSDKVTVVHTGGVTSPAPGGLIISEIMYHPEEPDETERMAGFASAESFEFVELFNSTDQPIELGGSRFSNGVSIEFTAAVLQPGEHGLVVSDATAFLTRYGGGARILGVYSGSLSNGGESITISDAIGTNIDTIEYDDSLPWPPEADGAGYSLTRNVISGDWRPSALPGGSPGSSDRVSFDGFASLLDYVITAPPTIVERGAALQWLERTAADDASLTLEHSSDLTEWFPIELNLRKATSMGNGSRELQVELPNDRDGYYRFRVSRLQP